MNQYAVMTKAHWARFLPGRFSRIANPDSFFSTLGLEVEEEIDLLTQQMAGPDPAGEDYLGKVGRLTAAREQAREKVLAERVLLPAEAGSPMDEELDPVSPNHRTTGWVPVVEEQSDPWWRDQEPTSP